MFGCCWRFKFRLYFLPERHDPRKHSVTSSCFCKSLQTDVRRNINSSVLAVDTVAYHTKSCHSKYVKTTGHLII